MPPKLGSQAQAHQVSDGSWLTFEWPIGVVMLSTAASVKERSASSGASTLAESEKPTTPTRVAFASTVNCSTISRTNLIIGCPRMLADRSTTIARSRTLWQLGESGGAGGGNGGHCPQPHVSPHTSRMWLPKVASSQNPLRSAAHEVAEPSSKTIPV